VFSVYCLEFDSRRIITGSRDRTIKVWSLRTGKQIGSFAGWHKGSVLCLKFEKDWDREWSDGLLPEEEEEDISDIDALDSADAVLRPTRALVRTGFMVSGSSDTTVCVWDLHLGAVVQQDDRASVDDDRTIRGNLVEEADREVKGEVRSVLKGHNGGVLDIRIDKQWIVSW
jgi:F-box and WD-40 domain protein 1/11